MEIEIIEIPLEHNMVFGLFHPFYVYSILIVLVMAVIFYWLIRSIHEKDTPVDILEKRYALGEIDKETFRQMKKDC